MPELAGAGGPAHAAVSHAPLGHAPLGSAAGGRTAAWHDGAAGVPVSGAACHDGAAGVPVGGGHGIIGMRERVSLLGGEFSAGPLPGYGFQVSAWIPLPAPAGRT